MEILTVVRNGASTRMELQLERARMPCDRDGSEAESAGGDSLKTGGRYRPRRKD